MQISSEKTVSLLRNALRKGPLFLAAVAGMTGIALADANHWILLFVFATFLGVFAFRSRRLEKEIATLLAGATLPLLGFGILHHQKLKEIDAFPLADALAAEETLKIRGTGWLSKRPIRGERSTSGTLHIESLVIRGTEIRCNHQVPVWITGRTEDFRYGTTLSFSGVLSPLEPARSPGGFDPAAFYYRESGSLARLEIRAGDDLEILEETRGKRIVSIANRARDTLEQGLLVGVDSEEEAYARLVAAMSLGARENSPEDLEDWFRRSGTMHIFAVSGLHVGILASLLLGTLLAIGVPRRYAILCLIPLLFFYAVMTGLRPSAVRAAVMLAIFLGAFVVKEKPRPLNHLAFAALALLLFDTQQLFLPGFQLSFAVLLSISLFASPMQKWTAGPWLSDSYLPKSLHGPVRKIKDHVVSALTTAFAVSFVSWLGSLGLLVWHFQSFSPVGIVANLFLVPFVGIIVTISLASLTSYGLHLVWLTSFLNQLNVGAAVLLTSMAHFFAELPGAHRHAGRGLLERSSAEVVTLDIMGSRGELATLWGWQGPKESSRRYWMLDSGGERTYQQEMLPLLRSRSINGIEALILSHGDIGHIGAAPQVMTQLRPTLLLEPEGPNRSTVYPQIRSIRSKRNIESLVLQAGMRLRPNKDVVFHVLSPGLDASNRIADDRSLVLRAEVGKHSILFTSDIGFEIEKALLESGADLQSDLWIRGQHGETSSGLPSFASAVGARYVISTHADFPSSEAISSELRETLQELGFTLLTLDKTGVITLRITPEKIEIETRGKEPRQLTIH